MALLNLEILLLFSVLILVCIGMFALARWTRRRNLELKAAGGAVSSVEGTAEMLKGNISHGAHLFFHGDTSKIETLIGKALVLTTLVSFLALVSFIGWLFLLKAIK